ncbi:hypothetical protein IBX73_08180 [candidate division WOR-3 bacterium]|nr:hypothetical protein [candidate division WOR-3 bacterium]
MIDDGSRVALGVTGAWAYGVTALYYRAPPRSVKPTSASAATMHTTDILLRIFHLLECFDDVSFILFCEYHAHML